MGKERGEERDRDILNGKASCKHQGVAHRKRQRQTGDGWRGEGRRTDLNGRQVDGKGVRQVRLAHTHPCKGACMLTKTGGSQGP